MLRDVSSITEKSYTKLVVTKDNGFQSFNFVTNSSIQDPALFLDTPPMLYRKKYKSDKFLQKEVVKFVYDFSFK